MLVNLGNACMFETVNSIVSHTSCKRKNSIPIIHLSPTSQLQKQIIINVASTAADYKQATLFLQLCLQHQCNIWLRTLKNARTFFLKLLVRIFEQHEAFSTFYSENNCILRS